MVNGIDIEKWLQEPCEDQYVKYLDANKTIAYLPIGIVEQYLDVFDSWGTSGFKFVIYKASTHWFASGSVKLKVKYKIQPDGKEVKRVMTGAMTLSISSADDNMDYEGTLLSYCISNAAKKLGKRFGRHLNGRLDIGETGLPVVQVKEDLEPDEETEKEYKEVEKKLKSIKTKEEAQTYLLTTKFKHYIPAKQIVNSKIK